MTPRGVCGTFPMLCRHCVGVSLKSDICRISKTTAGNLDKEHGGETELSSFILMSGHQMTDECFTLPVCDEVLYCVYIPMNLILTKNISLTNIASNAKFTKNHLCKEVKVKNVKYKFSWQWECLCTCMWGQGLCILRMSGLNELKLSLIVWYSKMNNQLIIN